MDASVSVVKSREESRVPEQAQVRSQMSRLSKMVDTPPTRDGKGARESPAVTQAPRADCRKKVVSEASSTSRRTEAATRTTLSVKK